VIFTSLNHININPRGKIIAIKRVGMISCMQFIKYLSSNLFTMDE